MLFRSAINQVRDTKDMPEDDKLAKIAELEMGRKVLKEDIKYPMALDDESKRYVVICWTC